MKLVYASFVLPLTLAACAIDATPPEEGEAATIETTKQTQQGLGGRVDFCLPGEKRVCTLGPPPVCHCELPKAPPVFQQ